MPRHAFTLTELLVVICCTVICVLVFLALPELSSNGHQHANRSSCTNNLKMLGLAMELYKQGPGKNRHLPRAAGSAFLLTTWHYEVIEEPSVFICPDTDDENGDPEGSLYGPTASNPYKAPAFDVASVPSSAISYAGRDNRPGSPHRLDQITVPRSQLALASDDFESAPGKPVSPNHEDLVIMLYADYHVDRLSWKHDLGSRQDCLGPGGIAPLDALLNGPGD